jgi:hypothetical protein
MRGFPSSLEQIVFDRQKNSLKYCQTFIIVSRFFRRLYEIIGKIESSRQLLL